MSTRFEIEPFRESTIPYAADLLAVRHARDLALNPLLPQRFATRDAAQAAITAVWEHKWTSGVAVWQGGQLIGYLFGEVKVDTRRGRYAWVQLPGHALAEGINPELYADMYAAAAPLWTRLGSFEHYIMMPATDQAGLDIWFNLSFGLQQAHALRDLAKPLPPRGSPPEIEIRLATPADRDAFVNQLIPVLQHHMTLAPIFSPELPEFVGSARKWSAELLTKDDVYIWAAFADNQMLAYQLYEPADPDDDDSLFTPNQSIVLHLAATLPEAQGRGIGYALTQHGLQDAREKQYATCLVDWRTTNNEARRFWLGVGFKPAAYRLVRRLDPRIAWAHQNNTDSIERGVESI
ncbi:MAG: GNAT family N-acetyltransferase [Chloroflexota bacterium]